MQAAVLTGEGGRLVRPLSRGRDFEAVPEAVWRALFQWYGGSPALPRQCIVRGGTGAGHHPASTELELYPPCLRLWRHQPPQGAVGGARQQNANSWTAVVGSVASAYGERCLLPSFLPSFVPRPLIATKM